MKFRSPIVLTIMCCSLAALVAVSGCTFLPLPGFGSSSAPTSVKTATNAVNVVPAAYETAGPQTGAGTCDSGKTLCNGHCSDTQIDIGDCGGCGLACPKNGYCEEGQCYCKDDYAPTSNGMCIPAPTTTPTTAAQGSNTGCPVGLIPCPDGYCYCGSCGTQCLQGQTCTNGQCVGGATPVQGSNSGCPAGEFLCSDGNCYCGSCGKSCLSGQTCTNGQCVGGTTQPQGNTILCSDTFSTSPEIHAEIWLDNVYQGLTPKTLSVQPGTHSFTFKKAGYNDFSRTFTDSTPQPGGTCGGVEMWPMTQAGPTCSGTMCNGVCKNTQTDPANCGACNAQCATGAICDNGHCACPSNQAVCNRKCVDMRNDPNNCGSCAHICPSPFTTCMFSTCTCPPNLDQCGNSCVDTKTNNDNCGSCGTKCGVGKICSQGSCITPQIQAGGGSGIIRKF